MYIYSWPPQGISQQRWIQYTFPTVLNPISRLSCYSSSDYHVKYTLVADTEAIYLWLFFIGAALAQLNCILQQSWTDGFPPKNSRMNVFVNVYLCFLGLFLLSYPDWAG